MDLSMWIFADELSDYDCEIVINDGSRTIKGLRVLSEDGIIMESYAYIGNAAPITREEHGNTLLIYKNDHILIKNASMSKVFNRVLSIFEKYARWDEQLNNAINSDDPYQNVVDIAHEVFRSPVFFGHKSRRIYAITKQYTDDDVYEGWDELKNVGKITDNIMKSFQDMAYEPLIKWEKRQAIDVIQEGAKIKSPVRTNVYLNGEIWGHLYVYRYEKEVSKAVFQLSAYVAEKCEEILKRQNSRSGVSFAELSWIIDALEEKELNENQVRTLNSVLGLNGETWLVLYKISMRGEEYDRSELWFTEKFNDIKGLVVFTYNNEIIVLELNSPDRNGYVLERIKYLVSLSQHECGVSYPMKDIKDISAYYRQADIALRIAPCEDDKIHYFKDCALIGFVFEFKRLAQWRAWILPELEEMVKLDRSGGTEYFATLMKYLENNGNLLDTSKSLFIHRNTLIYRIKKIESILGVDLDNNMMMDYLKLCCNMVKDAFNRPVEL